MTTLKESALAYSEGKDISDLDKVPVDIEVKSETYKKKSGEERTWSFIELNGIKYKVKAQVLSKINELLKVRPITKFVKVAKGTDGQYAVIPLD
jgi:hypothetical protein